MTLKPKTVFLVDALGAAVTSVLLIGVLKPFHEYFGMPQDILKILSMLALAISIFSFCCFVFLNNNTQIFLRTIIVANLTYCILTLGLTIYHYDKLTLLGITYFTGEILVIVCLVYFEFKTLKAFRKNIGK